MSNSQTVPATAIKVNAVKSTPFRRAKQMVADIAQANLLTGLARQLALDSIGWYESLGKGKGKPARRAKKVGNRSGWNNYPFSSDRQDARIARTQRTVVINGFEMMQTIRSQDRIAAR